MLRASIKEYAREAPQPKTDHMSASALQRPRRRHSSTSSLDISTHQSAHTERRRRPEDIASPQADRSASLTSRHRRHSSETVDSLHRSASTSRRRRHSSEAGSSLLQPQPARSPSRSPSQLRERRRRALSTAPLDLGAQGHDHAEAAGRSRRCRPPTGDAAPSHTRSNSVSEPERACSTARARAEASIGATAPAVPSTFRVPPAGADTAVASLERRAAALRAKRKAWEATFEAEHGEAASEEQKSSSTVWCGIVAKTKHFETLIATALQEGVQEGAAASSDANAQADIFLSMPRRVAGAGKRPRRVGVTTETSEQTETQREINERTAGAATARGDARDNGPPLAALDVAADGCMLLRGLSREELAAMAARMVAVEVAAGQEVAREGEESEACWVVARGDFGSVHARLPGAPLQTFGVGDVVGAAALLHAAPMVASVACRSRGGGTLWRLARRDYRAALCSSKAQHLCTHPATIGVAGCSPRCPPCNHRLHRLQP